MAKVKEETTDVAKTEEAGLPATINYEEDAGAGFEEAGASAYSLPFLRILQAISPQAKKKDPEYIEGAEEGDFINTVTNELFKGSVTVIPCYFDQKYNKWAPNRGGFRGSITSAEYSKLPKETRQDNKGNNYEADATTGDQLVDTREHYVLIVRKDGTFSPALLAFTSTQLKKSKKWMSLMDQKKLPNGQSYPMFSQRYTITGAQESNDQGSWVGYKIDPAGDVTNPVLYAAAKQFKELVRKGVVSATPAADDIPF